MFKDFPTPGYQYRVKRNESPNIIENHAYGSVKGVLENANPFLLERRYVGGRATIYTGDELIIPLLPEIREIKTEKEDFQLASKNKNDFTIVIGSREIKFQSARAIRTMDTAADSWTARVAWNPGQDADFDNLIKPYTYQDAKVFIGDERIITGSLYTPTTNKSNSGITVDLEGFSYTADAIDSTMVPPYEVSNITPEDRANQLLNHIGVKSVFDFNFGGPFDRLTAEITDTIFSHLQEMIGQRGGLFSSTPYGNALFTRAKTDGAPVGTLEAGGTFYNSIGGKFDGRKMFNSITAIGESPGNTSKKATVNDSSIPRSRFFTFKADDTTDGDIENAAAWKRSQLYADAYTIQLPVTGWYSPNGTLWRENTLVTVIDPVIFAPDGFTFLIRQVEYVLENSGRTAILSLVPPTVYSGGKIILPWS